MHYGIFILIIIFIVIISSSTIKSTEKARTQQELEERQKQEQILKEEARKQEEIKELLPNFHIYYQDGFITYSNNTDYEKPSNSDIICVFEFDNGEKSYLAFSNNKIDINRVNFKDNSTCKVYMIFRGMIKNEFIEDAIVSNMIEINF